MLMDGDVGYMHIIEMRKFRILSRRGQAEMILYIIWDIVY